jgi:hypothetical protein
MTMYGSEYDGSDHGDAEDAPRCEECQYFEAFYHNGDYLCEDHWYDRFEKAICIIANRWITKGAWDEVWRVDELESMQVDIIRNPKHQDLIGWNLSFENCEDLEAPLYYVESVFRGLSENKEQDNG